MRKIFIIAFCVIFFLLIFQACVSKKEDNIKIETAEKINVTPLSAEILKNLKNMQDIMEFLAFFKENGAEFFDVIPKPEQYRTITDRKKMLVRLGMLSVDIAYLKIIGGQTQTLEYEQLFEKYVSELNLGAVIHQINEKYIEKLAAGIDADKLRELKEQWRRERIEFVERASALDEEFLVYFTLGVLHEANIIAIAMTETGDNRDLKNKVENLMRENEYSSYKFIFMLEDNLQYSEYAGKYKPAIDILYYHIKERKKYTPEKELELLKILNDFNTEIFDNKK